MSWFEDWERQLPAETVAGIKKTVPEILERLVEQNCIPFPGPRTKRVTGSQTNTFVTDVVNALWENPWYRTAGTSIVADAGPFDNSYWESPGREISRHLPYTTVEFNPYDEDRFASAHIFVHGRFAVAGYYQVLAKVVTAIAAYMLIHPAVGKAALELLPHPFSLPVHQATYGARWNRPQK